MWLIIGDLHLDDNPANEYRWGIFQWIRSLFYKVGIKNITHVKFLGDITENKDNHSAELVNRLVANLRLLQESMDTTIIVLEGNHDRLFKTSPVFFSFLNGMDRIVLVEDSPFFSEDGKVCFVPYCWNDFFHIPFPKEKAQCKECEQEDNVS